MGVKPSIIADPNAALKQARQLLASDPAMATRQARQLLESYPGDPSVLRLLGAGLRKLGNGREASQFERQAIEASTRSPAHREAARAIAAGDKKRAAMILEGILGRDDTDVVALVMLGLQLSADGEYEPAETLLRKAVESAPDDPAARTALVEHLHRAKHGSEALEQLDLLNEEAREGVSALALRANILRDLGRQDEEVEILERLAASEPRAEKYRIRLGHAFRNLGRTADAIAAYRRVLQDVPYEGTSWWSLANLKTFKFSDDDIATMERGLDATREQALNTIRLQFALGKAHEDRRDIERAMHHYLEGNRRRHAIATYNPEKITQWVDDAEKTFTEEFFAERASQGCLASEPIFVVGMQRSGSTLVEQILDSHPDIEGTAELTDLPAIVRKQSDVAHRRGLTLNQHWRQMNAKDIVALGQEYVDRTKVYRLTDKPFFTDKMPLNWMYVGIIRLLLPNAKIVDVRRHPLDCCFANFKQLYGKGLEHTYSMENMGRYYADYVRLLRHMDEVQPGKIHRVIYERLVDDIEGEVRRLLDYLGLPFDEGVLNFHSNVRSVRTISAEQVRRPINREGIGRWKPYEQWLGPLKTALGPALEDWDK